MNKTKIEWTDIPGYPGYKVTVQGQIKGPRKILKPMEAESGHLYVIAYHEKKGRKLFVQKLPHRGEGAYGGCKPLKGVTHERDKRPHR